MIEDSRQRDNPEISSWSTVTTIFINKAFDLFGDHFCGVRQRSLRSWQSEENDWGHLTAAVSPRNFKASKEIWTVNEWRSFFLEFVAKATYRIYIQHAFPRCSKYGPHAKNLSNNACSSAIWPLPVPPHFINRSTVQILKTFEDLQCAPPSSGCSWNFFLSLCPMNRELTMAIVKKRVHLAGGPRRYET